MKKINWAVIAPGNIATTFCTALKECDDAILYSVASRNAANAKAFAEKFDFVTYAKDQQNLLNDPQVDVVYIASPHMFHFEAIIACLQAGKAVLCEKPMTLNTTQAEQVFATAKEHNTFFMEAVWSRFMPVLHKVVEWVDSGVIGDVKQIQASFGINVPFDESHRLYDRNLAGGALLDLGIYPISFTQMVMREAPVKVSAMGCIGATCVDESNTLSLKYGNGVIASLTSAVGAQSNQEAWIYGSQGHIKVPRFWRAQEAFLFAGEQEEVFKAEHRVNGYEYEIDEVNRSLYAGLIESPAMSWNYSIQVMQIMDLARQQMGVHYPGE